jgi:hypothetical protein
LIDPDASAVSEQTLLRQFPRIEGEVVIPDKKEGVLIQPAGRQWRYFHEVTLRWLGTIVIIGTLAALLAAYAAGTDPHFGGTVRSQDSAIQRVRAVRALADGGLLHRFGPNRPQHDIWQETADAADRPGCVQRIFGSGQICARLHELPIRN